MKEILGVIGTVIATIVVLVAPMSLEEAYELCKDCLIALKKWVKGETE